MDYFKGLRSMASMAKDRSLQTRWEAKGGVDAETRYAAIQCCLEPCLTSDKVAVYMIDLLCKYGVTADGPAGKPPTGPGFDTSTAPRTVIQTALVRPVVLERLLQVCQPCLNQKQPEFNATLLHILVQLHGDPPPTLSDTEAPVMRDQLVQSCKLLLNAGADPNVPDALGSTPIHYALQGALHCKSFKMLSVLHRAMYGDDEQANEITKVLQQKPVQLVSELLQLASKGSSSPGPLVKLDAVSLARAKLLMGAAEVKFQTYDQLLQLIPLAGVHELLPSFNSIAMAVAAKQLSEQHARTRLPQGTVRTLPMAGNAPIKEENKRQWIAAMKQNPDHLGLYVMLRWNKRLHGLLVSDSTLLRCATAGIKTLIQYSSSFKRLPGSATAGRHTPVTTTYSLLEDPALSKSEPRQMPAFADIAYAVSTLVSWVCEQAGLADVNTDMARFEPLYAAGYHLDLCKIVAMGNKQALRGLMALCWSPDAAVEVLCQLSHQGCSNALATQVTQALNAAVKPAACGNMAEHNILREAEYASCLLRHCCYTLHAMVYQSYVPHQIATATKLMQSAVAAMGVLEGSEMHKALTAAAAAKQTATQHVTGLAAALSGGHIFVNVCIYSEMACHGMQAAGMFSSNISSDQGLAAEAVLLERVRWCAKVAPCQVSAQLPSGDSQVMDVAVAIEQGLLDTKQLLKVCCVTGAVVTVEAARQASAAGQLAADAKKLSRRDCCWNCGISAQSAKAAGMQLGCTESGRPRLFRCTRCKEAMYCSVDCQKSHWKAAHKSTCVVK